MRKDMNLFWARVLRACAYLLVPVVVVLAVVSYVQAGQTGVKEMPYSFSVQSELLGVSAEDTFTVTGTIDLYADAASSFSGEMRYAPDTHTVAFTGAITTKSADAGLRGVGAFLKTLALGLVIYALMRVMIGVMDNLRAAKGEKGSAFTKWETARDYNRFWACATRVGAYVAIPVMLIMILMAGFGGADDAPTVRGYSLTAKSNRIDAITEFPSASLDLDAGNAISDAELTFKKTKSYGNSLILKGALTTQSENTYLTGLADAAKTLFLCGIGYAFVWTLIGAFDAARESARLLPSRLTDPEHALVKDIAVNLLLILGSLIMLFPFYYMFTSAFKTTAEISQFPPKWLPGSWRLTNFVDAFNKAPFAKYFMNSIIVMISSVTVTTLTTIFGAFAFSRLKFPGREVIFSLLLSLMMVPFEMLVITNYQTIVDVGLVDTRWALVVPFTSSIFYMYILRNFFASVPDSLYYSARVDGSTNWRYLWKIMVPMASSSLVTIVLLNALASWNSFMWPMYVIHSEAFRTLPLGLQVFTTEAGSKSELLMAASTVVVLPVFILFIFARKYIVRGVARGGLKG